MQPQKCTLDFVLECPIQVLAAVAAADDENRHTCSLRTFVECAAKPAPPGVTPSQDPPEIEHIFYGRS